VTIDAQMKQIGINTRVDTMDWPAEVQKTSEKTGWHMAPTGLVSGPTFGPEGFGSYLTGTGALGNYNSDAMNAAYDTLSKAKSLDERVAAAKEIQRLFYQEVAFLRLNTLAGLTGMRSNIQNFVPWYMPTRWWSSWRST
jgi:ABC-type transport system substrate-binding protein